MDTVQAYLPKVLIGNSVLDLVLAAGIYAGVDAAKNAFGRANGTAMTVNKSIRTLYALWWVFHGIVRFLAGSEGLTSPTVRHMAMASYLLEMVALITTAGFKKAGVPILLTIGAAFLLYSRS